MSDRTRVLTTACAAGAIGGIWGWFYLTKRGRRVRDRIAELDRLLDKIGVALATGEIAKIAINEGRRLLTATRSDERET